MSNELCDQILSAFPELSNSEGYILFGVIERSSGSTFCNWRINIPDSKKGSPSFFEVNSIINNYVNDNLMSLDVSLPHGYIHMHSGNMTFQLTSSDIIETILSKIDAPCTP